MWQAPKNGPVRCGPIKTNPDGWCFVLDFRAEIDFDKMNSRGPVAVAIWPETCTDCHNLQRTDCFYLFFSK